MAAPNSDVDICNLALGHLEIGRELTSINPPDTEIPESVACAKWYDQARRHVLNSHPWACALKRVSQTADGVAPAYGWETRYLLPSDYIRLATIGETEDIDHTRYDVEDGYILCNEGSPLKYKYVYDLTDVTQMDPLLVTAISYKLAEFMALELTGSTTRKDLMAGLFKDVIADAQSVNAQNNPVRRIQRNRLSAARRSGYSSGIAGPNDTY